MYYVYILQLKDKSYYHGYSENLKSRFKAHQKGKVESTKNFWPVRLMFYSAFKNKTKALAFEKYLKSSFGFDFRNKHLI